MHQPQHHPEMTPSQQDHIPPTLVVLDLLKGLGIARCIHVAVQLGLVDRLRDGPKSFQELAQATNTHASSLYRLLHCLASVGLFAETGPGIFASGVLAGALRQDRPDSIYHLAKWIAQGPDWKLWEHLEYSIRTGKPAIEEVYGMDLWRYLTTHPVESELYDTAMSSFSVLADTPVAQAYDFSSFGTLVDIGGGQGHLLMTILSAYPTVKLYCMKLGFVIPFHIPVSGYLIQTDDGLNVLVDTGFSHHLIGKYRHEEQPFVRMDEADYVVNQLARLGLAPQDIHYLISSHFDPDHAGNLTAFPKAHVVVQRRQYVLAKEGAIPRQEELRSQWDAPELRYHFVHGDTTFMPGIELIETSGHCPGHQSVLVRLPQTGPVLLAIDAIPFAAYLDPDTRPRDPFDMDDAGARASTRKLVELAKKEGVTLLVHGHDNEQWQQLKLLPEYYA